MHDVIAFLKDVVTRGPGSGIAGCYCVKDGSIYARNQRMQAGIEWDVGASFNVPADLLDLALARIKEVDEIKVEEDALIVRGGKLRTTIRRVHDEPQPPPEPPDGWLPSSPGLAAALGKAKVFVGDRNWQQGVRLMEGRVTCFSPSAGIDINVPTLKLPKPCLLTQDVCAVLSAQGDADAIAQEENAITFKWEDGRWLRAQYLYDEMPEKIVARLFDSAGSQAPCEVDDDFRKALADAAALSDGNVTISSRGIRGLKENFTADVEYDIDVSEEHNSFWKASVLAMGLEHAVAWNPEAWPNPALFIGDNIRGLIAGYKP